MQLKSLAVVLLFGAANLISAVPVKPDPESSASKQVVKLQKQYNEYIHSIVEKRKAGCTSKNILYRQEWGSLSPQARKDYIKAVYCLQKKQPLSSRADVPGARSHFDDFIAVHIQQTEKIHFSGLFIHWHRYFIWLYEKALREECGYKGTQPYWDWTLSWQDPSKSAVFDGSATSMGSNGKSIPHNGTTIAGFGLPPLTLPPGTGGGCIVSGPFKDYTVNLGPVTYEPKGPNGGLGYNPRCLVRDISPIFSNDTRPSDVLSLLTTCNDIGCFNNQLENPAKSVHSGGHFQIGGIAIDAYASPADPAFYLHHTQIDRMWTIWQNLDAKKRMYQVSGTRTAFNNPPSANVTLDTPVQYGVLARDRNIREVSSSIDGPFCYVYI